MNNSIMHIRYRHTQIGYVMIAGLTVGLLVVALLMVFLEFNWIGLAVCFILLLALGLFPTLTVELTDELLLVCFGLGYIWKKFPLKNIQSCRVVKNPWFYGWGIRWTPHGWLYRVSGTLAVEIQLKNGRKCLIGSNEPEELAKAIWNIVSALEH